ncbi:MAG: DEAD/DEAH box helicase [Alphaproteobacteria bacterium]|nr:DEAD/DEAH box helicase [Alphaproteobacteria bacterium]
MHFKDLALNDTILKAITDCGYETPTPIQVQAIPAILTGRDVVGLAQTGTGKTAGFTLPMIQILSGGRAKARMPRSLVLAPTRELAAQVAENFETYGKYTKLTQALLTGGTSMDEQVKKLERGVDVLIATPGRLIDLFERGRILLRDIKILVIDEADRMMDMGFIPDVEKIVSLLPAARQTLLFSATMPPEIRRLTKKFQRDPQEIAVAPPSSTADRVRQFLVWTSTRRKKEILETIIQQEDVKSAFIFCNRKRDIGELAKWLAARNYSVKELHGDMVQSARTRTLEEFKGGEIALLVCSDVAARGIDVDELSHVFNYDVPHNAEDYVHRIGRTGRAGAEGRAWTIATQDEEKYVSAIKALIKKEIEEPGVSGSLNGQERSEGSESSEPSSQARSERNKSGRGRSGNRDEQSRRPASPAKVSEKGSSQEASSSGENPEGKREPAPRHERSNIKNLEKKPGKALPVRGDRSREDREDSPAQERGDIRGFGNDVPGFFRKG